MCDITLCLGGSAFKDGMEKQLVAEHCSVITPYQLLELMPAAVAAGISCSLEALSGLIRVEGGRVRCGSCDLYVLVFLTAM
jgi:hypothetical protein